MSIFAAIQEEINNSSHYFATTKSIQRVITEEEQNRLYCRFDIDVKVEEEKVLPHCGDLKLSIDLENKDENCFRLESLELPTPLNKKIDEIHSSILKRSELKNACEDVVELLNTGQSSEPLHFYLSVEPFTESNRIGSKSVRNYINNNKGARDELFFFHTAPAKVFPTDCCLRTRDTTILKKLIQDHDIGRISPEQFKELQDNHSGGYHKIGALTN